jgi:hypothetical protein
MAGRGYINNEGALYEAYARGNKDTYFFKDLPEEAVNPFEPRYHRVPPVVHELRRTVPLNGADFGRATEIEFDIAGDLFQDVTLLIDLPTWLPPTEAELNATTPISATATGNTYGYTSGIAYFLFKNIQVYQDKLLLAEMSGDALFASRLSRGSLNSAYLENALAGVHDGSPESIARNATPGRLRLRIPFPTTGDIQAFPSIAMRQQGFKIRLTLRKLEDLVESSGTDAPPAPWTLPSFTVQTDSPYTIQPLARTMIGQPTLQLETRHIYTDEQTRIAVAKTSIEIPSSRLYENRFTFGPLDYAPLARQALAYVTKRVDAQHPASRLFWVCRGASDIRANRLSKFTPDTSGQEYTTNQAFYIAGRDREPLYTPLVWNLIVPHAKGDRDPGLGYGEMNWDLGSIQGVYTPIRRPEGSVNFTTADRPTLYTELATIPDASIPVEMIAVVDTWLFYLIEANRGYIKYGN